MKHDVQVMSTSLKNPFNDSPRNTYRDD